MGNAVFPAGGSFQIHSAVSATTLSANQFAIATYTASNAGTVGDGPVDAITVHFGPGQAIPATIASGLSNDVTYNLYRGVIFSNS